MDRIYNTLIRDHFAQNRQMVFLMGPRQVGKTTTALMAGANSLTAYFNWDDLEDREQIVTGPGTIAKRIKLDQMHQEIPLVIFDEIHKFPQWQTFIKGFFDKYQNRCKIIVTGSSRLDLYKKGGDSLMGRYFYYRLHPLSIAETISTTLPETELIKDQKPMAENVLKNLLDYGGFPEPFLKANKKFYTRWRTMRQQQLLRDDIRDLTRIQEIGQIELLSKLIRFQVGQLTSYTSLSKKIRVSVDTIRRWIETLATLYYSFSIRPWSSNISRSLLKEPKYYLWDWSLNITDGAKHENFVASHLLKAVHFWSDYGLGDYNLYYLRNKEKKEVDFLVCKNNQPWFLVEVKKSANQNLSANLEYFQKQTGARHAFQVVFDLPAIKKDCFNYTDPIIVPVQTLLGQLV